MARRGPKAAGKSPDKQPLDLIIYKGGIAVPGGRAPATASTTTVRC